MNHVFLTRKGAMFVACGRKKVSHSVSSAMLAIPSKSVPAFNIALLTESLLTESLLTESLLTECRRRVYFAGYKHRTPAGWTSFEDFT